MNVHYFKKVKRLIETPVPKFLSSEWSSYLTECSEIIEAKQYGWRFLKKKLIDAEYAVTKDGTVLPFRLIASHKSCAIGYTGRKETNMENYKWDTVDGRFDAARRIMKLRFNDKDNNELKILEDRLEEAIDLYSAPDYIVIKDMKNKKFLIVFTCACDAWDEYVHDIYDDIICYSTIDRVFVHGLIIKGEPDFPKSGSFERWRSYYDNKGKLWFIQM